MFILKLRPGRIGRHIIYMKNGQEAPLKMLQSIPAGPTAIHVKNVNTDLCLRMICIQGNGTGLTDLLHMGQELQKFDRRSHIVVTDPHLKEFVVRSEEHTSELQSRGHLVCRLLLEKKNRNR